MNTKRTVRGILWIAAGALACGALACGSKAADMSTPEGTLQAVFDAAKKGDDSALAGLCDPAGTGDRDVKRLCAHKKGGEGWDAFVTDFKDGRVDGAAEIKDDKAKLPFKFGADGKKSEEMKLRLIGGKWYLGSF